MKNLSKREIAEVEGLDFIETTSERNGYPSNLKGAIIGFESFKQAEEIAEKYELEIQSFEKKDGWALWFRSGSWMGEAFKNSSDDYGDNYSELAKMDEAEFLESEVKYFFEDDRESFDEIEAFLNQKKEIWEEIEKMEDDEIVITNCGSYSETIKKESMYFYHDTKHLAIGLI
jgi:hypothetical protein